MKRFFALMAVVLGMVSCQTEPEGFGVNVAGEQDVNITVSLPEGTRANSALGAFDNIDMTQYDIRYIFQVFNAEGTQYKEKQVICSDDTTVSFPVRLIPNRTYNFVVWADLVKNNETENAHYTIGTTLKEIEINKWAPMDETRDAYTGCQKVLFDGSAITVELTRPFAKLRVVTTDMEELLGVAPAKATVVYSTDHYKSFNALSQTPETKELTKSHTPAFDIVSYDETGDKTLFTDYFFATAGQEVVKFEMEVFESNDQPIIKREFTTDIPVKRNYVTTIKGDILTMGDNIAVEILPDFANAGNLEEVPFHYVAVSNGFELVKALYEGREIIVLNDITVTAADVEAYLATRTAAAINPVINLNGFTITFVNDTDEPLITIAEGSELTITDDSEDGTGAIVVEGTGVAIENNGTINIEGGKLNDGAIVNNGEANISGGELKEGAIENKGTTNVTDGKINENAINDIANGKTSITGGEFTYTPDAKDVDDDYEVKTDENGKITIERKDDVAKIGEEGYTSIQKAVAAAQNGDTVLFIADVEQVDGVIITDKNITIDLNNKRFTVSNGANTNNRNFKVNGSSVVTIKNGTMVAAGEYSSGAYGTLRTEGTANVTLDDVILYNYRGNGLNVKALSGTTVTINDTEIYSQYGGGIESAGGTIELTNVKVEQKGMYTAPYNSMAISVNGGGTVTVNSGTYSTECITAEEANNQGTSHGPWCAGVLNSGGTLIIKGGTFSNDNFGENTLATHARGLLLADTGANIQIQGGTFNAVKAIIDMTNNLGDASRNPSATISGGDFSADPQVSGLYASHLIKVAEGYKVVENNGRWTVVVDPVAKIGETEYDTLEEAIAAAKAGDTITLLRNITLAEELGLPAGIIFNGNGKQINGTIYAGGDLTFAGHTKVTSFSASYYDRVITIGEGACLEVTGGGRVTLGYGNTFNINGSIEDAKSTDKQDIYPSLIIPGGISITGGNNATMNVTNAYVKIGSTTSKPGVANGEFALNFTNAIAEFTKELGFYEPTGGKNPTFVMNIEDSVFTTGTKLCVAAANSTITVDNSTVTLGTYLRNSGAINLANGSVLTGKTIQFGENGGNNGSINVDNSSLTIIGGSTGNAFDGKGTGSINATNGATVNVDYYKDMTINVDATSTFTGTDIYGNRKIYYTGDMKVDPTGENAFGGATIVSSVFEGGKGVLTFDRDITTIGKEAFRRNSNTDGCNWWTSITLPNSITTIGNYAFYQNFSLETINIPDSVTSIGEYAFSSCNAVQSVTIGSGTTNIGSGAFYASYNITEIICKSTTPPTLADKWVFYNVTPERVVVPAASVEAYKAAWSMFADKVVAGEF